MTPEELIACIGDYDGLAVRSATKVTPQVLAAAGNLKVVGQAGIGVDNVDIPGDSRGVVVVNAPFGSAVTAAEHAIGMILALARRIPAANASTRLANGRNPLHGHRDHRRDPGHHCAAISDRSSGAGRRG